MSAADDTPQSTLKRRRHGGPNVLFQSYSKRVIIIIIIIYVWWVLFHHRASNFRRFFLHVLFASRFRASSASLPFVPPLRTSLISRKCHRSSRNRSVFEARRGRGRGTRFVRRLDRLVWLTSSRLPRGFSFDRLLDARERERERERETHLPRDRHRVLFNVSFRLHVPRKRRTTRREQLYTNDDDNDEAFPIQSRDLLPAGRRRQL